LGEHNFFCACETHRKIVSDGEPTEKFLSFYFRVLFSDGTPTEKIFFPWVFTFFREFFAHTEEFEFPVVSLSYYYHDSPKQMIKKAYIKFSKHYIKVIQGLKTYF
jgi:hypothetical protein